MSPDSALEQHLLPTAEGAEAKMLPQFVHSTRLLLLLHCVEGARAGSGLHFGIGVRLEKVPSAAVRASKVLMEGIDRNRCVNCATTMVERGTVQFF